MYKEIKFGSDAREEIKEGVNIVTDAVSSTLGPRGQNVIFDQGSNPTITKDGVTVAQQVFLEDKFQNMGNMLAREAAENTNREAGDGTTTTLVLLREIINEGHKAITAGMNPILLKRGMDEALDQVLEQLDEQAKEITTDKQKEQVATISANNDSIIGKMIADVIKKVGTEGVITVSPSNELKTEVEYVQGTKLNSGYESHLFVNDQKNLAVSSDSPSIIVTTDKITMQSQLIPLIEMAVTAGKTKFILFADHIEGNAMAFLVQNYMQGKFTCVPVILPSFGGHQQDLIFDLAAMTGATVLGEDGVRSLNDAEIDDLGLAERVIITRDETILSGTKGDIKEKVTETKARLKEEKDQYNLEKLRDRLGRLTGSIANIKVGGASESEQNELRYRMEDAVNATKSAIEEGIVEGAGCALLRCNQIVIDSTDGEEYNRGQKIVANALKAPLREIVNNSGLSGDAVVDRVTGGTVGYNALTGKYTDLFLEGVVDPKKVVRHEITNAVATAGILLTSGCAIALKPEEKK